MRRGRRHQHGFENAAQKRHADRNSGEHYEKSPAQYGYLALIDE
jgi:hypothetical protein